MSKQTSNQYVIPVDIDAITSTVRDNPSHTGAYEGSIDFAVPVDTPVLASATGTITRVQDDSDTYGDDIKYGQDVNYISILHDKGEISEYLHLAKGSSLVKVGDQVKAGQQIARTGLSGWMTAPHLHWMVYKATDSAENFQCLQIRLK